MPYAYKFSRNVIFADEIFTVSFLRIICYQPLSSICIGIVSKDLIFVDDKLPTETAKITPLENLYICGTRLNAFNSKL